MQAASSGMLINKHLKYLKRSIKIFEIFEPIDKEVGSASCIFWHVDQETFEIFKTTNKKYLKYLNQSIKRWVSASCIFWHVDQEIFEIRI